MKSSNNLPDDMKIACCKTCMLAEAMKDCKSCPFRIGLGFKALKEAENKTRVFYVEGVKVS